MPAVNRRNTALGWTALLIVKRAIRRKARAAARAAAPKKRRVKRKVFALLVAAAIGACAVLTQPPVATSPAG